MESAIPAANETPPQGRWGYANAAGELAIPARYEAASDFSNGRALVMLDSEYVFIDTAGVRVAALVDSSEISKLPALPPGCPDLESYMSILGGDSTVCLLIANPTEGEQSLDLEVRKLGCGAIDVRERGREGWSRVLVLPGRSVQDARGILDALVESAHATDVSDKHIFADDVATYQVTETQWAGEFYGIRMSRRGVEIHHTFWAS